MEHDVALAGGCESLRELSLRLIDGEARSAGATLLVAVGVPDEHALAPAVRLEVPAIQRIGQQLAHRLAAALERLEGLELRSDVQSDLSGALVIGLRPPRQQQRRQHVIGGAGSADDEEPDRVRAVAVASLDHGIEDGQRRACPGHRARCAFRRPARAPPRESCDARLPGRCSHCGIVEAQGDHPMQHARMLPDIQSREMKAESVDPAQQPLHVEQAGVGALVGLEAGGDELDVGAQLPCALVAVGTAVIRVPQPLADLRQEHAVGHPVVARRRDRARTRQQCHVFLDALRQRRRDTYLLALCESAEPGADIREVRVDDDLLMARQRFANGFGVHVRVAVHVPAHPRAEVQQRGQLDRAGGDGVQLRQRLRDLFIMQALRDTVPP